MSTAAKILVVDDTPHNVKLLADLLAVKGYEVITAASGAEALEQVTSAHPDLVLLDVVMPGMSGYEVCRRIRENPATAVLPVVMVTALDPAEERIKGIEAGADDFLTKPINQPELLARVRSLLRIKSLHDQLEESNRTLEQRVAEQVEQLERLSRLKRFFSPQLAELILSGGAEDPLKSHRREITVVFLDLRGFTAFAETAEPEEVMGVLREYHGEMGRIIMAHDGTLERFAGDGMMVFFNDPVPVADPAARAVRMVLAMHERLHTLTAQWQQARLRARLRRGDRAGLRHHRCDRLRGAAGLRCDRDSDQSRRAPVRRGAARADPDFEAGAGVGGGTGGGRADRRAAAQGLREAGAGVQCHRAEALTSGATEPCPTSQSRTTARSPRGAPARA